MRHQILWVASFATVVFLAACSTSSGPEVTPPPGGNAGSGSAGSGPAGATGAAGLNAAGVNGSAGTSGAAGGAAGATSGVAGATDAGAAGAAGATTDGGSDGGALTSGDNYGGITGLEDLSTIKPSPGCGTDITTVYTGIQDGMWQPVDHHDYKSGFTIAVTSPPNHPVVPGQVLQRRYFIRLPPNYDKTHPYKVIYQGAGCTGHGTDVSPFDTVTNGKAIQVALEIYPNIWGGGSDITGRGDPSVSCFDDKRGDLSIEKPFIEKLHPLLESQLCIDEHRVFMAGHSSGGWLSNQFGAAYGSGMIRAVSPSSGGLAQGASQQTPDGLPVPGFWEHQPLDGTNPFQGTHDAIVHALMVNKCTTAASNDTGTSFMPSTMMAVTYPNVTEPCYKFTSCPAQFPIIVCEPSGSDHGNNLDNNNNRAAVWSFFDSF